MRTMAKVVTAVAVAASLGWSGNAAAQRGRFHGGGYRAGFHGHPGGWGRRGWVRAPGRGYRGWGYRGWGHPGWAAAGVAAGLAASAPFWGYGYYPYGPAYEYYPYPAPFPYCSYYPADGCFAYPPYYYPAY